MLQVEIYVKGWVAENWSEWFENLTITHAGERATRLAGMLPDQAALYGLLAKLWSLGLCLVSVNVAQPEEDQVTTSPNLDTPF